MSQPSSPSLPDGQVGVSARVIAAGVLEAGNRLRLTLSLTPTRAVAAGQAFAFQKWPMHIEELLLRGRMPGADGAPTPAQSGWSLQIAPARNGSGGQRASPMMPTLLDGSKFHLQMLGPALSQDVTNFWVEMVQRSVGANASEGQIWSALAEIIGAAEQDGIQVPYYPKNNDAGPQVVPCGRIDATLLNIFKQAERATARMQNGGALPPDYDKDPTNLPESTVPVPPPKGTPEWNAIYNPPKDDKTADKARQDELNKADAQAIMEDLNTVKDLLEQAKTVADAQCAYLQAGTAQQALTQLRGLASAQAKSYSCSDYFSNDARNQAQALGAALHRLATAPDAQDQPRPAGALGTSTADFNPEAQKIARVLLFAVRSYPVLARLFRFVVDIDVATTDFMTGFVGSDWRTVGQPQAMQGDAFCFLALIGAVQGDASPTWTIAKAKRASSKLTGFWPATREEMELRLGGTQIEAIRNSGAACQLDGVVDLGQRNGPVNVAACGSDQRYSLVTVDPGLAAETAMLSIERPKDRKDAQKRSGATAPAAPFGEEKSASPVTCGLVIADRWRGSAVAAEIETARCWRANNGSRILDAEDLTMGYRFDVAVPSDADRTPSWRGLMERKVEYERPDLALRTQDDFKIWLTALGLDYDGDRRNALDAAHALPASRRRVVGKDMEMIHVDEQMAAWSGDPLGLACKEHDVTILPGAELPITRKFDLVKGSSEWGRAPWPLRYGWAYRFGARPVWVGGVALSLDEARQIYDSAPDLALPGGKRVGWRRFLRHEPILAPIVLLPVGAATEATWLGRQSATKAVLRTSRYDGSRSTPTSTWRLVLPPHLSLEDAMRHGAFDARTTPEEIPAGAISDIDYGQDLRFPVFGPAAKQPLSQRLTELLPEKGAKTPNDQGEPVFRPTNGKAEDILRARKENQFYPDPLADSLVIALRPAGTKLGQGYFKGAPTVVPVRADARDFTRIVPVAIEFVTEGTDRTKEPTQSDFVRGGRPILRSIKADVPLATGNPPAAGAAPPADMITARVVTIVLRPGEAVEADCWFLPSTTALRRFFDLPETFVAMATLKTPAGGPIANSLEDILPGTKAARAAIETEEKAKKHPPNETWTGLAGTAISAFDVESAARALFEYLNRLPLPELAAVQTISATHAVDQPVRAPEFPVQRDDDPSRIRVFRVKDDSNARKTLLENLAQGNPPSNAYGDPGDTGILLSGQVLFDRETCRQLELRASCAFSNTSVFDDPMRRGRTASQRLTGFWPRDPASGDPGAGEDGVLGADSLFGFKVASDGRVSLPQGLVTLRQFDDLGSRDPRAEFIALDSIDLVTAQRDLLSEDLKNAAANPIGKVTRTLPYDPISDTLARKLTLQLRATTRFDAFFRRVIPDDTLLAEDVYSPAALEGDADAPLTKSSATNPEIVVWIPSTKRPAKPKLHAVLPSFHEMRGTFNTSDGIAGRSYNRIPRLRVMLDRPWFSSGEDERLALVLWPPRLREIDPQRLTAGDVPRDLTASGAFDDKPMLLRDFTDDDLGPGGRFVTRWGADPIRESQGPVGPFLPKSALEDLAPTLDGLPSEDGPRYVELATVPIMDDDVDQDKVSKGPAAGNGQGQGAGSSSAEPKIIQRLQSALVTYVPRFDVENEKWFVDVALAPDQMVEPFVRLGLVRYQPYADHDLQASAPIAAWAQILPQRTVHVWIETGAQTDVLHVQVNGAYAGRSGAQPGHLVYPVMHVAVQEVKPTGTGLYSAATMQTVQDAAAEAFVHLGAPSRVLPCPEDKAWYRTFTLPKPKGPGRRALSVLIEEREEFMSSDDVNAADVAAAVGAPAPPAPVQANAPSCDQPVPPAAAPSPRGATIQSGPRLLARIDIEQ